MKKKIYIPILVLAVGLLAFTAKFNYRHIPNKSFERGEHLEYRAHYGFLNAGYAKIDVTPKLYRVNNRICYKVDVYGRSMGSMDLIVKVRDTWRSYVDTGAFVTQKFYRHIEEGKYRKTEETYFNHEKKEAHVVDKKRKIDKKFKIPKNAQDIVSGFYYVRNLNFDGMKINDTIKMPGFLEKESYNFNLVYKGKGTVKTKVGKVRCKKLVPVMPKNGLFDGEESIKIWVSDDKNRVPVKIQADMFIGAVEVDLKKYSGLKHKLNLVK